MTFPYQLHIRGTNNLLQRETWADVQKDVEFWLNDGTPIRVLDSQGELIWDSAHGKPLPAHPPVSIAAGVELRNRALEMSQLPRTSEVELDSYNRTYARLTFLLDEVPDRSTALGDIRRGLEELRRFRETRDLKELSYAVLHADAAALIADIDLDNLDDFSPPPINILLVPILKDLETRIRDLEMAQLPPPSHFHVQEFIDGYLPDYLSDPFDSLETARLHLAEIVENWDGDGLDDYIPAGVDRFIRRDRHILKIESCREECLPESLTTK